MYNKTENAIRVSAAVLFLGKITSHYSVGICLTTLIYMLVAQFIPVIVSAAEDFLTSALSFRFVIWQYDNRRHSFRFDNLPVNSLSDKYLQEIWLKSYPTIRPAPIPLSNSKAYCVFK
jgi:hypothetical protein